MKMSNRQRMLNVYPGAECRKGRDGVFRIWTSSLSAIAEVQASTANGAWSLFAAKHHAGDKMNAEAQHPAQQHEVSK